MIRKMRILFVSETNSIRSQMAEALLRHTDAMRFDACSAGLEPDAVSAGAVAALEHAGVDAGGLRSKSLAEFRGERFDCAITLCAKSEASRYDVLSEYVQAAQIMCWHFDDPPPSAGADAFRHMLHELHERIKLLVLIKTKPAAGLALDPRPSRGSQAAWRRTAG